MEGMVDYQDWRFRRSGKSVKTLGDLRDLGDLLKPELLPFYLASFEESPESYLAPSRGDVWGTRRSARYTEQRGFV